MNRGTQGDSGAGRGGEGDGGRHIGSRPEGWTVKAVRKASERWVGWVLLLAGVVAAVGVGVWIWLGGVGGLGTGTRGDSGGDQVNPAQRSTLDSGGTRVGLGHGRAHPLSEAARKARIQQAVASITADGGWGAQLAVLPAVPGVTGLGVSLDGCWETGIAVDTNVSGKWTVLVGWREPGLGVGSDATVHPYHFRTEAGHLASMLVPSERGPLHVDESTGVVSGGGHAGTCQLVGAWAGW